MYVFRKKNIAKVALAALLPLIFATSIFAEDNSKLLENTYDFDIIVIDPGHGGHDAGAVSKNRLYEKDVTLTTAKKLKSLIEKNLKVKVYLTREKDKFVSLGKRTRFANDLGADLFLSIHANSSEHLSTTGCESFFYEKDASDEQARLLAELENKGALKADKEPEDPLEFILMDMAKSEHIELSYKFAEVIQSEYINVAKSRDRGVKQAPFMVLGRSKMPAVLTEIGFLNSRRDGNNLEKKDYLDKIAKALFNSIKRYKEITEIKSGKTIKANGSVD